MVGFLIILSCVWTDNSSSTDDELKCNKDKSLISFSEIDKIKLNYNSQ